MPDNLYDVLGIDPSADDKMIKKAFRKKAMEHHPDKGGDREEFEKIQTALVVLSDPESRAHYDRTGEYGERTTHDHPDAQALIGLAALFDVIFANCRGNVESIDFVSEIRKICQQEIANTKQGMKQSKAMAEKWRKVGKRLKVIDKRVQQAIEYKARGYEDGITAGEKKIKDVERILEILKDATYKVDEMMPGAARTASFGFSLPTPYG